jgi:hypothetical protein
LLESPKTRQLFKYGQIVLIGINNQVPLPGPVVASRYKQERGKSATQPAETHLQSAIRL